MSFNIQISIIENTATISDQTTMKNDFVRIKHQANKILKYPNKAIICLDFQSTGGTGYKSRQGYRNPDKRHDRNTELEHLMGRVEVLENETEY